ncbi:MAG TPA: ABC transporter permease [Blastocatellia bacterium]|nr:ABC transporter permease [Blastocatellia bacterium]
MATLWQDLRYATRMLLKSPTYTAVAILALALGIGANTAIFSVVNALLLRPLPYIDSERLVLVESANQKAGAQPLGGVSPADFWDFQEQSESFEQLVAMSGGGFSLTGVENPESFPGARVSTNFFDALHARPLLGRTFRPEDGFVKADDTIILSYRLWQERFGGDPNVIGTTLGDTGTTVIGVMPPDFKYPGFAQVWIPLSKDSGEMHNRSNRYFGVMGMLKPGQTLSAAQTELQTIAGRLEAQYPDNDKEITAKLTLFRKWVVRDVQASLWILMGAVTLILLIACANVANLLLARAASRRKELAIRFALGASRWRVMQQLLAESLLLALIGGAAGLLLALWGVDALMGLMPASWNNLKLQDKVGIDLLVLAFTLATTLVTGIALGLIPAWQASRPDVNEWLKEAGRGSEGVRHRRTRNVFVVTEIALALVVLIGAGLLINSFLRLQRNDLGFNPRGLMNLSFAMPFNRYPDDAARSRFIKRVLDEATAAPGVEAVAATSGNVFPFLFFSFSIVGQPQAVEQEGLYDAISPNYFRVIGAEMTAGREFNDHDDQRAPAVAIINESLRRQYFADSEPLGQRITVNFLGRPQMREIVGVVRDFNQGEPGKVTPQVFVCYLQQPWLSASLLVRSAGDTEATRKSVQSAIWAVDKTQPARRPDMAETVLNTALGEPRLYTLLLGSFAALALVLAAVGIYGVMSYSVAQRTQEIGIRMALGASPGKVLRMIVGQGMTLIVAGITFGLIGAFVLTRLLASLLFRISATDPLTYAAVILLLALVALAACYIPARRATKVDPMIALRYE